MGIIEQTEKRLYPEKVALEEARRQAEATQAAHAASAASALLYFVGCMELLPPFAVYRPSSMLAVITYKARRCCEIRVSVTRQAEELDDGETLLTHGYIYVWQWRRCTDRSRRSEDSRNAWQKFKWRNNHVGYLKLGEYLLRCRDKAQTGDTTSAAVS